MADTRSRDTGSFSKDERAAIKQRAGEVKKTWAKMTPDEREAELSAVIDEMPEAERALATRIREIVAEVAPALAPRTFYGMPAWEKDGKVVVFMQPATKFRVRYSTLGFQDAATLDDGDMWPTAYALSAVLTAATEKRIAELVARAAG